MAGKITKRELSNELSTDINSRIKFVTDNTSNIEIPGVDEKLNDINTKYDEVTSQLELVNNYVKCSEIGLDTLDDGINNFIKLKNYIENTAKDIYINIDNNYKINVQSAIILNRNICLYSDKMYGFDFCKSTGTLFEISANIDNIKINNISLINNTNIEPLVIFGCKNEYYFNTIKTNGCYFKGGIRSFNFLSKLSNPHLVKYGIGEFYFVNNTCEDIYFSFIQLNDIPHKNITCSNNTIKNWSYKFLSSFISNSHPYIDEMFKVKQNIYVNNNVAICDDNWIHSDTSAEPVYYTLSIIESDFYEYKNNYVEGMKTYDNVPLYDTYASAKRVIHENNIYKNNCVFYENTKTVLLKAKTGDSRLFKNNTYIVEESWFNNFSKGINCRHTLYDIHGEAEIQKYVIEGISVNVINLFLQESRRNVKEFIIKDNIIKAKNITNHLVVSSGDSIIIIDNNVIESEEDTTLTNVYKLVSTITSTETPIDKLIITNNKCYGMFRYGLEQCNCKELIIENNTFNSYDDTMTIITYSNIDNVISYNNKMYNDKYNIRGYNRVSMKKCNSQTYFNSNKIGFVGDLNLFPLKSETLASDKYYIIKIKSLLNDGEEKDSICNFKITNQDGLNRINFYDNNSSDVYATIGTTEKHGVSIKQSGESNINFIISNTTTSCTIRFVATSVLTNVIQSTVQLYIF